ncbi:hypothetical protein PAECIP111893_00694 [Paenibacillus plantiphilus]|uniref:Uncharacterized protein n=1 Tax=Paenibacillus plantiphilus TaxID=2905650 RepID=A0ABM9BVG3_9BACL|nr:hypothetical protein PAECIP111893_00694 [Paenibacillus plantiphilus]
MYLYNGLDGGAMGWKGPVNKASGLGIASREYVRALRRQGVSTVIGAVRGGNKIILNPLLTEGFCYLQLWIVMNRG